MDKTIIDNSCIPCLTYASKAFAGFVTIQLKPFDANNTACLWFKDAYKNKFDLRWFKYILPKHFLENVTSKEGVSYLNKEIVLNIDIDIPSREEQLRQIKIYEKIENLRIMLDKFIATYEKLINKSVIINEANKNLIPLNKAIDYISRNDSLSEEGIYNLDSTNKTVTVLSGNSSDEIYGKIDTNQKNIHYLLNKQGFRVISRGNAGQIKYLPKGNYATNTNAFIFYLLDSFKKQYGIDSEKKETNYLKFLCLYLQPIFYSESSNSDVSVFPLTQIMKSLNIPVFVYNDEIQQYAALYDYIQSISLKINKIKTSLDNLTKKYII